MSAARGGGKPPRKPPSDWRDERRSPGGPPKGGKREGPPREREERAHGRGDGRQVSDERERPRQPVEQRHGGGDWERPRRPGPRADVAGPPVAPPPAYKPEQLAKTAEKVAAACLEVQRQLGSALDATVYQRALALEMQARNMPFEREARVPVAYKGRQIDTRKVDFAVDGCLVELVSQPSLSADDLTRATNYLRASGYRFAVLVNFGPPKPDIRTLTV